MNYNNFWDNVLKQEEWNDELKRWENTHPEYEPFKEDSDSQRRQQQELVWIKVSNLQSSLIVWLTLLLSLSNKHSKFWRTASEVPMLELLP